MLTPDEVRVMVQLFHGKHLKEVAIILGLADKHTRRLKDHAFKQLGAKSLLEALNKGQTEGLWVVPRKALPTLPKLTKRELEVCRLTMQDLSNAEIAQLLGVSKATIRTHLEHSYTKLDITNYIQLAQFDLGNA